MGAGSSCAVRPRRVISYICKWYFKNVYFRMLQLHRNSVSISDWGLKEAMIFMWITLPWFFHYLIDGQLDIPGQWMSCPLLCDNSDLWFVLYKYLISSVMNDPVHSNCSFSRNVQKAMHIHGRKIRNVDCPCMCVWMHSNTATLTTQ